jgi:hypothetical protein
VSSGNLERFTIPPSAAGLGTRLDRADRERQPGALSETYVEGSGMIAGPAKRASRRRFSEVTISGSLLGYSFAVGKLPGNANAPF